MVLCQWWDWDKSVSQPFLNVSVLSVTQYIGITGSLLWIALRGSFPWLHIWCICGRREIQETPWVSPSCPGSQNILLFCHVWSGFGASFLVRISHGMYKTLELLFFLRKKFYLKYRKILKIFQKYNWIKLLFEDDAILGIKSKKRSTKFRISWFLRGETLLYFYQNFVSKV